ncbi:hypothetical protein LIER_30102 [Lithospermum erythrorhizon]|uniref:Reverse transcriptase zinc-binding domain-containing protein n=1 Tax=Lithospermum erythrorhizon TaxID=34254 RepID=A0AAV3RRQ8_LITER
MAQREKETRKLREIKVHVDSMILEEGKNMVFWKLNGDGRLCRRDNLAKWVVIEINECSFCAGAETNDHLFFKCDFSACVWRNVLRRLKGYRDSREWSFEGEWCSREFKSKSFRSTLGRVAVCCTVYHIWMERNMRIFTQEQHTREQVINRICNVVSVKASSWKNVKVVTI